MSTFIQKGNLKLFTVQERNYASTVESGYVEELDVCSSNLNHLYVQRSWQDGLLYWKLNQRENSLYDAYYDMFVGKINMFSTIYRNESVILSGTFYITNLEDVGYGIYGTQNYNIIQQDLIDLGHTDIKPVIKPEIIFDDTVASVYFQETGKSYYASGDNVHGTFSQSVYFNEKGQGVFEVEAYRGRHHYSIQFDFADVDMNPQYVYIQNHVISVAKMRRKVGDKTDTTQLNIGYNKSTVKVIPKQYQSILLPKFDGVEIFTYDGTAKRGDEP